MKNSVSGKIIRIQVVDTQGLSFLTVPVGFLSISNLQELAGELSFVHTIQCSQMAAWNKYVGVLWTADALGRLDPQTSSW